MKILARTKKSPGLLGHLWVLALSALFFIVIALLIGGAFYAGHFLAVDVVPCPADAGVVLAGSFARAMYAADLYQQGLIPRILITRPGRERGLVQLDALGVPYPRQEDVSRAVLLKKGVPEDRIELIGEAVVSTLDEARLLAQIHVARPEYRSLLIITSRFHVRRATAIFLHAFLLSPHVRICVIGTPYDGFVADRWWTDRDSATQVVLETVKLALFWVVTEM